MAQSRAVCLSFRTCIQEDGSHGDGGISPSTTRRPATRQRTELQRRCFLGLEALHCELTWRRHPATSLSSIGSHPTRVKSEEGRGAVQRACPGSPSCIATSQNPTQRGCGWPSQKARRRRPDDEGSRASANLDICRRRTSRRLWLRCRPLRRYACNGAG